MLADADCCYRAYVNGLRIRRLLAGTHCTGALNQTYDNSRDTQKKKKKKKKKNEKSCHIWFMCLKRSISKIWEFGTLSMHFLLYLLDNFVWPFFHQNWIFNCASIEYKRSFQESWEMIELENDKLIGPIHP